MLDLGLTLQRVAPVETEVQSLSIVSGSSMTRFGSAPANGSRPEDVYKQFARIDGGLWAWDFWLKDRDERQSRGTSNERKS